MWESRSDFQAGWEEGKSCLWISTLSTQRHFHGLLLTMFPAAAWAAFFASRSGTCRTIRSPEARKEFVIAVVRGSESKRLPPKILLTKTSFPFQYSWPFFMTRRTKTPESYSTSGTRRGTPAAIWRNSSPVIDTPATRADGPRYTASAKPETPLAAARIPRRRTQRVLLQRTMHPLMTAIILRGSRPAPFRHNA